MSNNGTNYSIFVSYSSKDDVENNYWIKDFIQELHKSLDTKVPNLGKFHNFIGEPIGSGSVRDALENRILKSRLMLAIVGKHYLDSEHCQNELYLFCKNLSAAEIRDGRIYFVVLSNKYLPELFKTLAGREVVAKLDGCNDVAFSPFYDTSNEASGECSPMPIYVVSANDEKQRVDNRFHAKLRKLSSDLGEKLTSLSEHAGSSPANRNRKIYILCQSTGSRAREGTSRALDAMRGLRDIDVQVSSSDDGELPSKFKLAEKLIILFDGRENVGDLYAIFRAWRGLNKTEDSSIWIDTAKGTGAEEHFSYKDLKRLESIKALSINQFESISTSKNTKHGSQSSVVQILIESNAIEKNHWNYLASEITATWKALANDPEHLFQSLPEIDCLALPINHERERKLLTRDADGVILLWGAKNQETIYAQMTTTGNEIRERGLSYEHQPPKVVAWLSPPRLDSQRPPSFRWGLLPFRDHSSPPMRPHFKTEEESALKEFLIDVASRWQLRNSDAQLAD